MTSYLDKISIHLNLHRTQIFPKKYLFQFRQSVQLQCYNINWLHSNIKNMASKQKS